MGHEIGGQSIHHEHLLHQYIEAALNNHETHLTSCAKASTTQD